MMTHTDADATPSAAESPIRADVPLRQAIGVFLMALVGVVLTRGPVMRVEPFEPDEFLAVEAVRAHWFNVQHTLFLAAGRAFGLAAGDPYRGFVALDMLASALALTAVWWWLRAVVRPATAAAATLVLAAAPLFWGYGATFGSYLGAVAVGSFLLGVAVRGWRDPRPWQPYAAAVVMALGAGYRSDIGILWLPVFVAALWPHRWSRAVGAGVLFTALNLVWVGLMLREAGGLAAYRAANRDFAFHAGYLNSVWNLGLVDAPLRYAVKLAMSLVWTFGPGLVFAPRGLARLARGREGDRSGLALAALLVLSVVPALGMHLLVHFGSQGYGFHYVPALVALIALGIGRAPWPSTSSAPSSDPAADRAPARLLVLASVLAAVFLFYPTDYTRPGVRGDFDLAFARHTRLGLLSRAPLHNPSTWRTANSRALVGPGR